MKSPSVIGVIPARYASTRFPGKPLVKIHDKEMILWVAEAAKKSKSLSEVYVATDDDRIEACVEKAGFKAIRTPSSCPSGTDRVWEAVKNKSADVIINIQGDEPLLHPDMIEALVQPFFLDASLHMTTLAHAFSSAEEFQSQNVVKVICNEKSEAIYFSRFLIPYSRSARPEKIPASVVKKHVGLYGYRKSFLQQFCAAPVSALEEAESLEQLRALYLGARIKVIETQHQTLGIDTPEDLERVKSKSRG